MSDKEISDLDCCYNSFPVCPHCGEEQEDCLDGQPDRGDGDEWETECCECEKRYTVEMCVVVTYDTRKLESEESEPVDGRE